MHFMHELISHESHPANHIRGHLNGKRLDPKLLSLLRHQPWRGNVMELKVVVRTLLVLPYERLIDEVEMKEINSMIAHVEEGKEFSLEAAMNRVEQAVISRAIESCGGNIRKAGQLLGLTESAMHRRKATLLFIVTYLSSDSLLVDLLELSLSFL
jgi:DNA-binding NtrC family response regulator